MKDFLFMVYACEEQKKEDFIDALSQEDDPEDEETREEVANRLGIDTNLWTDSDWSYINQEVWKRT